MSTKASGEKFRLSSVLPLVAAALLVLWIYGWIAQSGRAYWGRPDPAVNNYNLLVQGLRTGHLSLNEAVPPGLAKLTDPYDPAANAVFRQPPYWLHDQSYYHGKFYLYFGITPALVLFWPWAVLTGHFLLHRYAVAIFCAVGFLAGAALLRGVWRRYFPETSVAVTTAGILLLGLATGVPIMLQRAEMWEVAVSCGYAFAMLALGAVWQALHKLVRRTWWLAAAGTAFGLALGARPALLFGAAILLVPVALAGTEPPEAGMRRRQAVLLAAVLGPLLLCGAGLLLYNQLRFDSPFEFGERYQLASDRQDVVRHFSLDYLWFNLRVYFLEPVRWTLTRPFAGVISTPPLPPGHGLVEEYAFGALVNCPILWLALAAPFAWRQRPEPAARPLRGFVAATTLLFASSALVISLFFWSCCRYEVEFLPALALLAAIGLFGLERALARRPVWRRLARAGWGLLLAGSITFNLLGSLNYRSQEINKIGERLSQAGQTPEAIAQFQAALRLNPGLASAHNNLGTALFLSGRIPEAAEAYQEALRLQPDSAVTQFNLGNVSVMTNHLQEAITHYQAALRLGPDNAQAHGGLGFALAKVGRQDEAVAQFQAALRLNPTFIEAHYNLGNSLAQLGQWDEAMKQFQETVRLRPDFAEAHYSMGQVLTLLDRKGEAAAEYREALRLKPELAPVQDLGPQRKN